MKKDRKRQIRRYDDYRRDCRFYYGVFKLHGKLAVDPKRLLKLKLITKEQFDYINSIPRNTRYFYPKYHFFKESIFAITDNTLNSLYDLWGKEFKPLIENIVTPQQYAQMQETKRFINISHYDDLEDFTYARIMDEIYRKGPYYIALEMFNVQFFLLYFSTIENLVLKICKFAGYPNEKLYEKEKNNFLTNRNCDNLICKKEYEGLRTLYNLIKHGSFDDKADYTNGLFCEFFDIEKYNPNIDLAILRIKSVRCLIKKTFEYVPVYIRDMCEKLNGNKFCYYKLDCEEHYKAIVKNAINEYNTDISC